MNNQHYERFQRASDQGDQQEAQVALHAFTDSFATLEEKSEWTTWYLESEWPGHEIHPEIYEKVVFPVLLDGYLHSDPWSLRWLARTIQNLYQARHLWEKIEMKTDYALLHELVTLHPETQQTRTTLLSSRMEWLQHCLREWPSALLHGPNRATMDECYNILEEIIYTRKLDYDLRHERILASVESKVREYQRRIARSTAIG